MKKKKKEKLALSTTWNKRLSKRNTENPSHWQKSFIHI